MDKFDYVVNGSAVGAAGAGNPTSIGGGNISVGGSVGQAGVSQQQAGSATGATVDVKADVSMPGMGGELLLINLNQLQLINLADTHAATTQKSEYVPFGPSAGEGW